MSFSVFLKCVAAKKHTSDIIVHFFQLQHKSKTHLYLKPSLAVCFERLPVNVPRGKDECRYWWVPNFFADLLHYTKLLGQSVKPLTSSADRQNHFFYHAVHAWKIDKIWLQYNEKGKNKKRYGGTREFGSTWSPWTQNQKILIEYWSNAQSIVHIM